MYAALIEERPYKSGLSPFAAARALREMPGKVDERCAAALEAIAAGSTAAGPAS